MTFLPFTAQKFVLSGGIPIKRPISILVAIKGATYARHTPIKSRPVSNPLPANNIRVFPTVSHVRRA